VIIVDDGIATGKTLLATLPMIRRQRPARIIIAVPVAPLATYRLLLPEVDELIVLHIPRHFSGVGAYYEDFTQVEDAEVAAILNDA
jgi:predicted phosphoribosyltransferase